MAKLSLKFKQVSSIIALSYVFLLQKPDMRQKYMQLKDINEHLIRQLEDMQQQLDQLNTKKAELEEELSNSPVKQEAGGCHLILMYFLRPKIML